VLFGILGGRLFLVVESGLTTIFYSVNTSHATERIEVIGD